MFKPQRCWASGRLLIITAKRSMASPSSSMLPSKAAGDISSVFPSLKPGAVSPPLPPRFAEIKRRLIQSHEDRLRDSWNRLLTDLREETEVIKAFGPTIVPELNFWDMHSIEKRTVFRDQLRKRGVAVIRDVVTEREALGWKQLVQNYIQTNPSTKGRNLTFFRDGCRLFDSSSSCRFRLRNGAEALGVSALPHIFRAFILRDGSVSQYLIS